MIKTILIIMSFTFISSNLYSQPGDDDLKLRLKWFHTIQDSIKEDPNNLLYRWARVDLLFDPVAQLRTEPTRELVDFLKQSSQFRLYMEDSIKKTSRPHYMSRELVVFKYDNPASELGDFLIEHQDVLINDLNLLLDSARTYEFGSVQMVGGYRVTAGIANYLYKRGQFFYYTGEQERAIQDFKIALLKASDEQLKNEIQTFIAAYFYSNAESASDDNYKSALYYIAKIEPAIEDSTFCYSGLPVDFYYHEESKLFLMKKVQDSTAYVNYLQNRSASFLYLYYSILTMKTDFSSCDLAYDRAQKYERMIYDYLQELNPKIEPEALAFHKQIILNKLLTKPKLH